MEKFAYCCDCGIRYPYKPDEELKGRPCKCMCCCDPDNEERDFEELHLEITEKHCLSCFDTMQIACSPWEYARKYADDKNPSSFCSSECYTHYPSECGPWYLNYTHYYGE